jgi:long-subunit acyl-CoA synthetase (AMP-forming)
VAVITVDLEKLKMFASVNGLNDDVDKLLKLPDLSKAVITQLDNIADKRKFSEVERIKGVLLLKEPFSQANGMMTNS